MATSQRLGYRLDWFVILVVAVFVVLVSRLGYLQIVQGQYYERLAEGNRLRLLPIMAPRGIIMDRNGVPLVSNRPGFTVSIVPPNGRKISGDVVEKLAGIIGLTPAELHNRISKHQGTYEPIRIKTDIGPELVTRIEERRHELPGVIIEVQPVRNYVFKELAAHVFGYVSEINADELAKMKNQGYKAGDIVGKYGLEKVFDKELRGVDGGSRMEVDVSGRPVQLLGKTEPQPGYNIILTIDYRIQKAAEEAVEEQLHYLQTQTKFVNAKAASVVVMNPMTGEILAMVSRPAFDPNKFAVGLSEKDWKQLNENPFHPMENKAIAGQYPPGSTFKVVTGTAALELGKTTPEEKILDTGRHWIIPKGNAAGEALGWIDFREALSKSDNVYFYEMGNRLGIDNLEKYARMFGLGALTGIGLPGEMDGLVANRKYKEKMYGEDWYLSETFDAAIGQGFQLATPLQIAVVYSEIANGGQRLRPQLVKKIVSATGSVVKIFEPEVLGQLQISPGTLNLIRDSLRDVAREGGTAAYEFRAFPLTIAGKTGTSENPHGQDHGWFVAYAPFEEPRVVVSVLVEQGGFGSTAAAPIARKILETVFNISRPGTDGPKVYRKGTFL